LLAKLGVCRRWREAVCEHHSKKGLAFQFHI
jgi:hypothetical protein